MVVLERMIKSGRSRGGGLKQKAKGRTQVGGNCSRDQESQARENKQSSHCVCFVDHYKSKETNMCRVGERVAGLRCLQAKQKRERNRKGEKDKK